MQEEIDALQLKKADGGDDPLNLRPRDGFDYGFLNVG
jgi:hypothetical protein